MAIEFLTQPLEVMLNHFLNSNKRVFWVYLCSALLLSFWFFRRSEIKSTFIGYVFNKKVWLHPSAKLDYMIWLINIVIKLFIIVPLLFASAPIAIWLSQLLENTFGDGAPLIQSPLAVTLWFTLLVFILDDFSRFLLHWLMHKVPFLWQLHKVHHSAEVLTPITVYRIHPLESALYAMRMVLVQGLAIGLGFYFFGHRLSLLDVLGVNLFLFIFNLMGSNLRHSHVFLSWGRYVENVFISPAQHQIHHSIECRHYDKNFGSVLAIWDRIFGTLLLAKRKNKPRAFGLKQDSYSTLYSLYIKPVIIFKNK